MKWKKIYFIIIGILFVILGIIIWAYFNGDKEVINESNEIIPNEEISEEQLRNTIISLYFIDKESGEIKNESRLIDVKNLLNNPYEEIINLWIKGPENTKLKNNCSENVKINNVLLNGDCITIDFSEEFISEFSGEKGEESKIIYCIVNTLTELTEVNSVRILINGEENKYLSDFNLSEKYCRIK